MSDVLKIKNISTREITTWNTMSNAFDRSILYSLLPFAVESTKHFVE